MPPRKKAARRTPVARVREPQRYVLPEREWHRATDLLTLFIATGWLAAPTRSQSIMLISDPGSGKTELLDRFNCNAQLQYASDLTVRGLYQILKRASSGAVSHIVATEFQKFFMRKAATADNTLGTLCQALEEGIYEVMVGDKPVNYNGVQVGFIGAITDDTMSQKKRLLRETGFLSRVAVIPWQMSHEELDGVMARIGRNDRSDVEPLHVKAPQRRVSIEFPEALSEQFRDYVSNSMRDHTVLRVFMRFRALAMASAALDGRTCVHARDVEKVVAFQPYWKKMLI